MSVASMPISCNDIVTYILEQFHARFLVTAHTSNEDLDAILLLSATCRRFRDTIDNHDSVLFSRYLPIHLKHTTNQLLKSYEPLQGKCAMGDKIDLYHEPEVRNYFAQKISTPAVSMIGKTIHMPVIMPFQDWDVKTWIVRGIEDVKLQGRSYNSNTQTFHMHLESGKVGIFDNNEVKTITIAYAQASRKTVTRRRLVMLNTVRLCQCCKSKAYTYSCPSASNPQHRKLCQACAYQLMVTPNNLCFQWHVGWFKLAVFNCAATRFYNRSNTVAVTWVPKSKVEQEFKLSWEEFIMNTKRRLDAKRKAVASNKLKT